MIDCIHSVHFFLFDIGWKMRSKRGKRIWIEFFYEEPTDPNGYKQFGGRRLWLFCQFPFIYGLIDLLAFKQAIAVRLGRWINILYIQWVALSRCENWSLLMAWSLSFSSINVVGRQIVSMKIEFWCGNTSFFVHIQWNSHNFFSGRVLYEHGNEALSEQRI